MSVWYLVYYDANHIARSELVVSKTKWFAKRKLKKTIGNVDIVFASKLDGKIRRKKDND